MEGQNGPGGQRDLVAAVQALGLLDGRLLTDLTTAVNAVAAAITAQQPYLAPQYVTGVWTPTLTFGGAAVGLTYGTQLGSYTRVGREVICRFSIVLTAKGASAGGAAIGGLPFTSSGVDPEGQIVGAATWANMAAVVGNIVPFGGTGSGSVVLGMSGAAGTQTMQDVNFTNTSTLHGSFIIGTP